MSINPTPRLTLLGPLPLLGGRRGTHGHTGHGVHRGRTQMVHTDGMSLHRVIYFNLFNRPELVLKNTHMNHI